MTARDKSTLKTYFNTGDIPTETNFGDLIDSFSLEGSSSVVSGKSFVPQKFEDSLLSGTGWTNDATGPCGIWTYDGTVYIKNITITSLTGVVLYTCDLSIVPDGSLPANWTVISGTWAVQTVGGEKVLYQSNGSGFRLIRYDGWDAAWETSGAIFTFQAKVPGAGNVVGPFVYCQPGPGYERYYWEANMSNSRLFAWHWSGGSGHGFSNDSYYNICPMLNDTWYWLKTSVHGSFMSCYFGPTLTDLFHWFDKTWGSTGVMAEDYGLGIFRGLWCTIPCGTEPTLNVYVDDPVTPIYSGPAGSFFFAPRIAPVFATNRLTKHYTNTSYYLFQDIPYTTYFRMDLVSTEITDRVMYATVFCERLTTAVTGRRAHFHALRTAKAPADTYLQLFLDVAGEGVLDAIYMDVSNSAGSFMDAENNIYIYRDNAYGPTFFSTGTEDFFLNAYYWGGSGGITDVAGITYKYIAGAPYRYCVYRRFLYDPFYFDTHIKILWNMREGSTLANCTFDAVVFYYTSS